MHPMFMDGMTAGGMRSEGMRLVITLADTILTAGVDGRGREVDEIFALMWLNAFFGPEYPS